MLYAYLEGTTYRRYMYVSCTHTYRPRFLVFSFSLVSSHLNQNHTRIHPTKLDEIFFSFSRFLVFSLLFLVSHLNQNHTRIHPTKLDEIFFCFLQNIVYTHSSLILHHAFY